MTPYVFVRNLEMLHNFENGKGRYSKTYNLQSLQWILKSINKPKKKFMLTKTLIEESVLVSVQGSWTDESMSAGSRSYLGSKIVC